MTPVDLKVLFDHGYLLIEPANFPFDACSGTVPMLHCTPSALIKMDDLMPRLIKLEPLDHAQRSELIDIALEQAAYIRPPCICAWLLPACAEIDLVRHIGDYSIGRSPSGNRVLWRYFDPRVFSLMMQLFSQQQREALLSPISEWRFIWCRRWWRVSGAKRKPDRLFDHDVAHPSVAQWAVMARSGLIARTLMRLDKCGAMSAEGCLEAQHRVLQAIDQAEQRYKLKDDSYLGEYAFLQARYGTAFSSHFRLSDEWRKLESGESSWPDVRDRLRPSDIQRLEEQLT